MGDDLKAALRSTSVGPLLRHWRFGRYHIFLLDTPAYLSGRIGVTGNSGLDGLACARCRMTRSQDGIYTPPRVAIDLNSPLRANDSKQGRP